MCNQEQYWFTTLVLSQALQPLSVFQRLMAVLGGITVHEYQAHARNCQVLGALYWILPGYPTGTTVVLWHPALSVCSCASSEHQCENTRGLSAGFCTGSSKVKKYPLSFCDRICYSGHTMLCFDSIIFSDPGLPIFNNVLLINLLALH